LTLATGARLGPYEITAKLGEGGMGEVYRATVTTLDRSVANDSVPIVVVLDWKALLGKRAP
jgi:serine/threonine protein kinase